MVYEYSWQNFNFPVPAKVVGEECERIERENGILTTGALVDSARDESSELHPLFEWDDKIAGEQWRNQQAKVVLSCLKITVKSDENEEPKKIRAFVNTNPDRSRGVYMNVEDAMNDYESRNGVLIRAKRELRAFLDKYEGIKELDDLTSEIKRFLINVA